MPVTKTKVHEDGTTHCGSFGWTCHGHGDFARKIILTLAGILLTYGIIYLGTLIRNNVEQFYFIGKAPRPEHTLVIDGEGKVNVVPDVGIVTMGIITNTSTVAGAQQQATATMQSLSNKLSALGVAAEDIQTTKYSIYPKINFTEVKGSFQEGYEVNQNVTVKIRDLSKASDILALAGRSGANNVSGIKFVVDNPESYRSQARAKALQMVGDKAKQLSAALGVQMTGIVSYSEFQPSDRPLPMSGMMDMSGASGAQVSTGSNEIIEHVTVTFATR